MIEKHLSVNDDVVKRKVVYRVAYHHWPELLILKNMNEKRPISVLISREEAGNYGNAFVDASIDLSDDSSQMHAQAPLATEIEVSTLVASFYRTPTKPTVDCGVSLLPPFPFSTVDVEPAPPILLPMMLPSKTTVKLAFDCCVPFFPTEYFNQSPSIHLPPAKKLPPTQPASNDPPSNAFFPHVNPPASDFLSVDALNPSNTNPEHPTLPTPIDCCVFISTQPPASNDTPPSTNAFFPHHVNPPSDFFQFESTNPSPIDCCVPATTPAPESNLHPLPSNPLPSNTLPSNPLPSNPTVDCCGVAPVPLPDSPDFKLPVNACHEYIKRKVLQHGIGQELLTSKFHDCIEQLQRIHRNFDPIVCLYGIDSKSVTCTICRRAR